ncbi:MAG: DUF2173 family protein [Gammaproteobacteria bacterium]|nr:DUF2173 family protein [Gammaproteobacteria bacterium]MBU1724856.1 DUF2173 family protein [Gammaproteobacteria bacterium]MBU2005040.1 DUF2173 family protein [Gammaproteobacteria bacterium]
MANFKKLLDIKGVVLAGEFSASGDIIAYDGLFPLEMLDDLSKICSIHNYNNKFFFNKLSINYNIPSDFKMRTIMDICDYYLYIDSDIFLFFDKSDTVIDQIFLLNIDDYRR